MRETAQGYRVAAMRETAQGYRVATMREMARVIGLRQCGAARSQNWPAPVLTFCLQKSCC